LLSELRTLLDPDGELLGECPLSDGQLEEAVRLMLISRALDVLAIKLQPVGDLHRRLWATVTPLIH
jgi:hypothetical protein